MNTFEHGLKRYLDEGFLSFLRSVRIGIIGAGGLGSNCAVHLVRCGFTDLVLADAVTNRYKGQELSCPFLFAFASLWSSSCYTLRYLLPGEVHAKTCCDYRAGLYQPAGEYC